MGDKVPDIRNDKVLTPADVAQVFRVDPKTVVRWSNQGLLTSFRTLGGHRRFRESEVRALLEQTRQDGQS